MKKFTYLYLVFQAIANIIMWGLNKLFTLIYLLLPVGLFLLIMQLRSKNNKATALRAFTDDNSEFQFIYPDYILVANKPSSLKVSFKKKISNVNLFLEKWKWTLLIGLLGLIFIVLTLKLL